MDLQLNEKLKKRLEEELSYINYDLEAIVKDNPEDLPKVYEEDFKKYLLPYMLNLVNKNEDVNSKAFFNNWIELVGDVVKDFYVVDEYGNILFKVPRYLAHFDNTNTPISDVSYITILKEFEVNYERFPEMAEKELDKVLNAISSMVRVNVNDIKIAYEFYKFLRERYKDYYLNYKKNYYLTVLKGIEQELSKIENQLEENNDDNLIKKKTELLDYKNKVLEELNKLGVDIDYNIDVENENKEDEEIEYED